MTTTNMCSNFGGFRYSPTPTNGCLGKTAIDTLDSLLMKKMAADWKARRKETWIYTDLLG